MPENPKQVLKKLQKIGFVEIRRSGSHVILENQNGKRTYIAIHTKDLPKGTFMAILKQAGITLDEYRNIK